MKQKMGRLFDRSYPFYKYLNKLFHFGNDALANLASLQYAGTVIYTFKHLITDMYEFDHSPQIIESFLFKKYGNQLVNNKT